MGSGTDVTTNPSFELENDNVDVEAATGLSKAIPDSDSPVDGECEEGLKEWDLCGADEFVYVPMPGQGHTGNAGEEQKDKDTTAQVQLRQAPSGCAVCLSQFLANEKISWSSNADCSHVFHHECLLRWFQAEGRKTQKKQLQLRPNMSEEEALDLLFQFPKPCPCCRRTFCIEIEEDQGDGIRQLLDSTDDQLDRPVDDAVAQQEA